MSLGIVIIYALLLVGGLGAYYGNWHSRFPGGAFGYGGGLLTLIVIILVVAFLFGRA